MNALKIIVVDMTPAFAFSLLVLCGFIIAAYGISRVNKNVQQEREFEQKLKLMDRAAESKTIEHKKER